MTTTRFFSRPRLWGLLGGLTLAVAQLFSSAGLGTAQAATTTCTPNGATQNCTVTFDYTGVAESWTVPAGVTSATFDLYGAQGGDFLGGKGGRVTATLNVSAGATYQLRVGGSPGTVNIVSIPGFNGGGTGTGSGGGGGGATDVRTGAFTLANRILVAGGGGGSVANSAAGGVGGYPTGGAGVSNRFDAGSGGGGTQSAGGAGGTFDGPTGTAGSPGTLGQGGNGYGAGGGGYYGGGGGGNTQTGGGAAGGGGSSFGPSGATFENGVRSGHGQASISYSQSLPDTTAPVANPTLAPLANAAGWNNTAVTVNWNWSDSSTGSGSGSGIDPAACDTTSSPNQFNGAETLTASCRDLAGNIASASYTVQIDRVLPQLLATVNPEVNGFGWYNSPVTVSFTCQDNGSGVAINTVGGNVSLSSEGTYPAVTNSGSCIDNAGNVATPVTVGPFQLDLTKPTISAAATTAPNGNGWYNSAVTVHFTCTDALSGIATCPRDEVLSSEGAAVSSTAQTARDQGLNVSDPSNVVTVKLDKTAPSVLLTGVTEGATYAFGSVPTATCSTTDALAGVATQATLITTGGNPDGSGSFTATCSGATDLAGNNGAAVSVNYTVTPPADSSAPLITPNVAGTLGSNGWYVSDVTLSWTVVDNESPISSQSGCETQHVTSDTAGVTFTCTATSAGGSSSESVTIKRDATAPVVTVTGVSNGASYTLGSVPTATCSTSDALAGVATQATLSITGGNGDGTGSFTTTCSGATDLAGNSAAPVSVSYTVTAPAVDACITTALRDSFNRVNGSLGSNWAGLIGQSYYKLANNAVDVQLGGPVVWKPTTYGVNQAAFVTLSTLDSASPAQGVLLKVQNGTIPNGGAIAVVYDSLAKAVRVSALRLNTPAWTVYGNTPATVANGDKLTGCVQANGTVRVYQNNSLLTTVTLNAADQSFFNAKGGKIGLWAVAAPNAFLDDFGGGALAGVSSATLDALPDEIADDGAEITVAMDLPTDDTATAPSGGAFANRAFLPLVTR